MADLAPPPEMQASQASTLCMHSCKMRKPVPFQSQLTMKPAVLPECIAQVEAMLCNAAAYKWSLLSAWSIQPAPSSMRSASPARKLNTCLTG